MNLSKRGTTLLHTFDDDDGGAEFHEAPQRAAAFLGNADAIRPEEQVVDNTCYYNLVSLWTSMYIRTKEGYALPIVFDAGTQRMVRSSKRVRFDFCTK